MAAAANKQAPPASTSQPECKDRITYVHLEALPLSGMMNISDCGDIY